MRTIEEVIAELRKDIHSDVYLGNKTISTYLDEILEIHKAESTQGDLISRSALKKALEVTQYNDIDDLTRTERLIDSASTVVNYYTKGFADGERSGRNFPLADEEKAILVRQWRPHGEWIEHYDNSDGFTWLTCSRCMFKAYEEDYNFCPNCGADMRKKAENDTV